MAMHPMLWKPRVSFPSSGLETTATRTSSEPRGRPSPSTKTEMTRKTKLAIGGAAVLATGLFLFWLSRQEPGPPSFMNADRWELVQDVLYTDNTPKPTISAATAVCIFMPVS